jgi:hypothetical protein
VEVAMKQLTLQDGDLVVTPHGHETVTGSSRVKQDLQMALGEEIGTDRFHPKFGSYLSGWIGQPITSQLEFAVEAEVIRVLNNYILDQHDEVLDDVTSGRRSRFSTSDVIRGVVSIGTTVDLDRIYFQVVLTTRSGENVTVTKSVEF